MSNEQGIDVVNEEYNFKPYVLGNLIKAIALLGFLFCLLYFIGLLIVEVNGVLPFIILIIGSIQSLLVYCFGHILNIMDDNNRLLQKILEK